MKKDRKEITALISAAFGSITRHRRAGGPVFDSRHVVGRTRDNIGLTILHQGQSIALLGVALEEEMAQHNLDGLLVFTHEGHMASQLSQGQFDGLSEKFVGITCLELAWSPRLAELWIAGKELWPKLEIDAVTDLQRRIWCLGDFPVELLLAGYIAVAQQSTATSVKLPDALIPEVVGAV